MPSLHDQIAAYLHERLPAAAVISSGASVSARVCASTDVGSYTIIVTPGPGGAVGVPVLDGDGDPLKNLFLSWQDAADTVVAALGPAPVAQNVEKC